MCGVVIAVLGAAACDDPTDPQAEVRVEAITATALTGTVGADVEPVPVVRATDENGRPLSGVAITFSPASGSGTIPDSSVLTGADGSATAGAWILGPLAGSQTLTASAGGQASVVFAATAAPGPLARLTPVGGDYQLLGVGGSLPQRLVARAEDAFGNTLAGVPVVFSVILGEGSIADAETVTDAAGLATSGTWTLGPEAGEQRVGAASGAVLGTFRAFAAPPAGPLEGRIAFESWAEPDIDVAIVNADGSGFTRVDDPWMELMPAWSSDGSRLATTYSSQDDGVSGLYTRTAEGGSLSQVTQSPGDIEPAWSPDGSTIAFSDLRDGRRQIAALDLATGSTTVLVDEPGYEGRQPAWSPDGRRLAFVSRQTLDHFVSDIYTAAADGTDRTRLTDGLRHARAGYEYYLHPAWSPDGAMIAFVYGSTTPTQDLRFRIAVMSSDGQLLKELAWAGDIPGEDSSFQSPGSLAWSPDGSLIAYSFVDCDVVGNLGCPWTWSVKYVALDGSREGTIAANGRNPSWAR
jgi:hypothetical protein